jgi:hypothetical protein
MVSLGEYAEKGFAWVKDNPVVGVFILLSAVMTFGSAIGSAASVLYGMHQQASVLADIAAAFATILLVGITGSYAISTQAMVRESRIERMRPHITYLIAEGVDEMLTGLENDEHVLGETDFDAEIPEFTRLMRRKPDEEVLTDLRVQGEDVMSQWDEYREVKSDYLNIHREVEEEIGEIFEEEFVEQHGEMEFTDFLPEDAEEEDLRSGMVGDDKSIQSMLSRKRKEMANCILENADMPSFEDNSFVGENEIIHRLFLRYEDELMEYRERDGVKEKLNELESLIQSLSQAVDSTIPVLEEFRGDLKSEYDVPETSIQSASSSRERIGRR